jgi:uncharacterized protein YggE
MKKAMFRTAAAALALAVTLGIAPQMSRDVNAMIGLAGTTETAEAMMKYGNMSVNGNGVIKADPDMAMAQIGVMITGKTASEAQNAATETIGKIVKVLKDGGVDEKDIQTSNYYMYPQYDYSRTYQYVDVTEPDLIGYTITHMLNVTVRDLESVGDILGAATEAGANQMYGVYFDIEDRDALYLKALELAIEDAQKKAAAIAKILKVDIGAPSSVGESYSYYNPYPYYSGGMPMGRYDSGMYMQVGQVEVTAAVYVGYVYER